MKKTPFFIFVSLSIAPAIARAGEGPSPRVVHLLDFRATTPVPFGATAIDPTSVEQAMRAQFDQKLEATAAALPVARFEPLDIRFRIPIPEWMRSRHDRPSIVPTVAPLTSGCGSAVYRPLRHVSRAVEARRRMIYPIVAAAACEVGLPVALMDALVVQESGYNPKAVSRVGAFGLTQLMPYTARDLGANPYDITENVRGGARYLAAQLKEFGRVDLALAAYNAGPGRVRARRTIPNITETRNYVRTIIANWSGTIVPKPVEITDGRANPFRQAAIQLFSSPMVYSRR